VQKFIYTLSFRKNGIFDNVTITLAIFKSEFWRWVLDVLVKHININAKNYFLKFKFVEVIQEKV